MSDSTTDTPLPLRGLEADAALRAILQGTAAETGQGFFSALVQNLAAALGTHGAWVTEYFPEKAATPRPGLLAGRELDQGL